MKKQKCAIGSYYQLDLHKNGTSLRAKVDKMESLAKLKKLYTDLKPLENAH